MSGNARNILTGILILIAGWGFTADSNEGKPSASIQSKKAQQTLTVADKARDKADYNEAIKLYTEALLSYTKLADSYPDWQPGVTMFRIAYCNNQLEALLNRMDRKETSSTTSPTSNSPEAVNLTPEPTATAKPSWPQPESTSPVKTKIERIRIETKLLLEKGDLEKARSVLLDGLKTEPDDKIMRMLMAMIHCRASEFENAMYLTESLVQEDPSNAMARIILGTAYYGLGRTPDATKQLQEALEINPRLAEAHYNLTQILLSTKPADTNAARSHYKSALELGTKPDPKLNYLLLEPAKEK